ncbi:hypothetical protein GCM10007304_34530 [Rhodococcoides trifolii]|uniref:Uncharacterized protein n=1 Tax=Rhodococcoides trifolii TaxID=908250 RepID=A0A917LF96_9NOCA|nr:hypothetical protein GCM10007304_34530 [Rhodococcus trifolii]
MPLGSASVSDEVIADAFGPEYQGYLGLSYDDAPPKVANPNDRLVEGRSTESQPGIAASTSTGSDT